jgi:hypothetical protein
VVTVLKTFYRSFSLPIFTAAFALIAIEAWASDWPRFRGPNGAGVSDTTGLPTEFGPSKNVIWRTPLPNGYSSPILVGDRIYLTGYEGEKRVTKQGYVVHDHEKLLTFALDRATGKILWRREAPLERTETLDARNSPASPTPVSDGKNLFVFFGDYGLVSYGLDGNERWKTPLGPFTNVYGIGVSPVLVDDKVILVIDQSGGSYIAAFGQNDGKVRWKVPRPEALSGHSTPSIMRDANGKSLIVAPASFRMDVYSADTGEIVWFMHGLASEMKSVPIIDGDTIYINGYNTPENDPGRQVAVAPFEEVLKKYDANHDGKISIDESPDQRTKNVFSVSRFEWRWRARRLRMENVCGVDGGREFVDGGEGAREGRHDRERREVEIRPCHPAVAVAGRVSGRGLYDQRQRSPDHARCKDGRSVQAGALAQRVRQIFRVARGSRRKGLHRRQQWRGFRAQSRRRAGSAGGEQS